MQLALARDAALDLLDRAATIRPRLPRRRWLVLPVVLALGAALFWWWHRDAGRRGQPDGAPLVVSSTPTGATVLIDGRDGGRTPTTARVPPARIRSGRSTTRPRRAAPACAPT